MSITLDIDVNYFQNNTGKTDQQIIDEVLLCTVEERNALATEARIAALKLLEGDTVEEILKEGEL
jgi:hypothetical protein